MDKVALATLFYKEVEKIQNQEELSYSDKTLALFRLLNLLFVEITRKEKIHFTTLFARIAYVCHTKMPQGSLEFYIHAFRRYSRDLQQGIADKEPVEGYAFGLKVLTHSINTLLDTAVPEPLTQYVSEPWNWPRRPANVEAFYPKLRVVILRDDPEQQQLIGQSEEQGAEQIRIQYNLPERNENFNPTIKAVKMAINFPFVMNLIDTEVDNSGIYRPRAFVVEPDYLIDVSAVAECFKDFGTAPYLFLLKKYLPFTTSKYLLIGNIANLFLDELMHDPNLSFKTLISKIFQLNPLALCLLEDREIREIMQKAQLHFVNLKRIIIQEFKAQGIAQEDSYLEPTFYSETYGLQGRLDVFYKKPQGGKKSAIIELKSGKAYKPNVYGLSTNHFIQTLLYDLIVRSVFGKRVDPTNYILYSGLDNRQLRFAPVVKAQQYEALQVRNQLVVLEHLLSQLSANQEEGLLVRGRRLFSRLRQNAFPAARGFVQRDISLFEHVFYQMTEVEQKYFIAFSGFIAREHLLAKTGAQGIARANGLAALWLNSFEEKQKSYEIISHLSIEEYSALNGQALIHFSKSSNTNPLANFRKGDIAVLYPYEEEAVSVLANQIFKCTIIEINATRVTVALRSRQFNTDLFEEKEWWNLEHDLMDGSFTSMYRGLFEFAQQKPRKKELLLGLIPPEKNTLEPIHLNEELTKEQQDILQKMLSSKDYFLLWGPPGTGKTSMVLKHAVKYLIEETEEQILLLAYTNRAVDEICESIERLGEAYKDQYFRVGSRYATAARFQGQLLNSKTAHCTTRKDLSAVIDAHRIVVATVASLGSKPELLILKSFDRLIIDEASQILEPLLVGLLPKFKHFTLVGDHKQLPAVVVQDPEASMVADPTLQELGLNNLRNSLFERLYLGAIRNQWDWAYAQLSHQGRMHQDIMAFPNQFFYENTLSILPEHIPVHNRQVAPIELQSAPSNILSVQLCTARMLFIPTPVDEKSTSQKTNIHEAVLIRDLIREIQQTYLLNEKSFKEGTVGVITPYRAQIAQIKEVLEEEDLLPSWLTIDTVERYQGGARDIILISLCTNSLSQLDALISLSEDGVDRKLNVALTRAKEQLILLGNPEVLQYNPIYKKLLKFCTSG